MLWRSSHDGGKGSNIRESSNFSYEPKWFNAFVMMNEELRKYWLGILKDQ